jgi:polyisoprenoid-binding protein YceI
MKYIIILIVVVVIGFLVFKPKEKVVAPIIKDNVETMNKNQVSDQKTGKYDIDIEKSSATWTGGKKLIKNYYDSGSISVKSGEAVFDKGMLTAGKIVFDMTSISAKSTGSGGGQDMLSKHLKSPDFFDAQKYPESTYTVTSATKNPDGSYTLNGNLTAKSKTAPLSVPATITQDDSGSIMISGEASVDRSVWEIKYGSETFFKDLGDKIINNIFTLKFNLILDSASK